MHLLALCCSHHCHHHRRCTRRTHFSRWNWVESYQCLHGRKANSTQPDRVVCRRFDSMRCSANGKEHSTQAATSSSLIMMKVRHYLLHHLITICVLLVTQYTILGLQLCMLSCFSGSRCRQLNLTVSPLPAIQPLSPNDQHARYILPFHIELSKGGKRTFVNFQAKTHYFWSKI